MTRRMIAPLVFGIVGVAILLSLGFWQLRRLEWKEAILAEIAGRLAAEPVAVPPDATPGADQYLRVRATGTLDSGELHVYTSVPQRGVGYRVIAPMTLADGRRVLLDRGFVPIGDKDAARPPGPIAVTGSLAWPQETDRFTSDPDRAKNIWFARDVPQMAAALETAPVMIVVAESAAAGAPGARPVSQPASQPVSQPASQPIPQPVTVNIPNDHLQYAITWFLLAIVWTLMTGYLLYRIKRRID
jgi:surfeit locus 1 family protein